MTITDTIKWRTQMADLKVMINWYSLDSQHRGSGGYPANARYFLKQLFIRETQNMEYIRQQICNSLIFEK